MPVGRPSSSTSRCGRGWAPGALGTARVVDTVTALGWRPDASEARGRHGPAYRLQEPGSLARELLDEAHTSGLPAVWGDWLGQLGLEAATGNNDMPECPKYGLPTCSGGGSPTMEERPQEARGAQQTADEQVAEHAVTQTQSSGKSVQRLDRVVIRFAGDSGDGMQLTGDRFTSETAALGNDLSTLPELPGRDPRAPGHAARASPASSCTSPTTTC